MQDIFNISTPKQQWEQMDTFSKSNFFSPLFFPTK